MKRLFLVFIIVVMMFSLLQNITYAKGITVKVDGSVIQFDVQPYIDSAGRTMVPIRFVAEKLGATVDFKEEYSDQLVLITKNDLTIILTIGDEQVRTQIKGVEKINYAYMDTVPVIKDGRTFIPLRHVVETLGASISWDKSTSTVSVDSKYIGTGDSAHRDYAARFDILKPVLGVEPDRKFVFPLKYNDLEHYDVSEYAEVYSDPACLNKVFASIEVESTGSGKSQIVIKPGNSTGMLMKSYDERNVWGHDTSYYIVLKVDTQASSFKPLERFRRLMFTVATPVDIPTLQFSLSQEGYATLKWSKVEGAEEYKIYAGYGDVLDKVVATTKDTEYSKFTPAEHKEYINFDFRYRYAVSAVKDGKESRLSNVIDHEDYDHLIPDSLAIGDGDNCLQLYYKSLRELPGAVDVSTLAYPSTANLSYKIKYDYKNAKKIYYSVSLNNEKSQKGYELPYSVLNTPFKGAVEVWCEDKEEALLAELQKKQDGVTSNNGVTQPDVPQIVNESKVIEPDKKDGYDTVEVVDSSSQNGDIYKYITEKMIAQAREIDLSNYVEASDWSYLKDLISMIYVQEPLVMNETGYKYDYASKILYPQFRADPKTQSKIEEVKSEAKRVISTIIKPSMSIADKEKAIHDYITSTAKYDIDALKNAEENNFERVDDKFMDSFNPYGVLVKKVGVCQSYSDVFTLLCREAGLEVVSIHGTMDGVAHAWNKFKINGKWYHVDPTNNDDQEYPVYNASDATILPTFIYNNDFELDDRIDDYKTDDNFQDYYTLNKLTADTIEEAFAMANEMAKSRDKFSIKVLEQVDGFDILSNQSSIPIGFGVYPPFASVLTFEKVN